MTEQDVARASVLIHARDEITEFLAARDPQSALVKSFLESKYDFQQKEGAKIPGAETVGFSIYDAKSPTTAAEEEADTLVGVWYLPRTVLERALERELAVITEELTKLGVV